MQIAIGTYDHTKALKDGSVTAPGLSFDFFDVSPITRAFRPMATEQAYDVAEMALVTYMLARIYNKPIVALPIVLVRSSLLPGLVTAESSPITDPRDLNGKTLGIRSYTQTSGVWVRGILQDGFGVDLGSLKWVTFEGAHLDEYSDPPSATRAPADANMAAMVKSGELAAAIGVPVGDGLRSLVPNAAPLAPWSSGRVKSSPAIRVWMGWSSKSSSGVSVFRTRKSATRSRPRSNRPALFSLTRTAAASVFA